MGSLIIVLHAPPDKEITSIDEILQYAAEPGASRVCRCALPTHRTLGFLMYCFSVLVFSLFMIYVIAPKHGRSNPLVYISICSLVGSVSVMAVKGFGVAVKLTLAGNNQFARPGTYVFGITVAGCILVQMNYFNKALDTFSTNVYVRSSPSSTFLLSSPFPSVNPMYFVGFSTSTLVASLILFQGFNTSGARDSLSLLSGFIVTFLGVHLLNISRKPEPPLPSSHSALEAGLMNPRLSIQGRMSIDGWHGINAGNGAVPLTPGHGRRSSLYRAQTQTLFNAFENDDELPAGMPAGSPALQRLQEESEDEEDDDDDANERTHLRTGSRGGSRSNSPRVPQDDTRRSPQYR